MSVGWTRGLVAVWSFFKVGGRSCGEISVQLSRNGINQKTLPGEKDEASKWEAVGMGRALKSNERAGERDRKV
jgi:hypothetical protein